MAKRKITLLYGEGTVQVYFRLPENKRDEIEGKFWDILKEYENPTKVEIEVSNPFKGKEHPLKEKKSNPTDEIIAEVSEMTSFEKAIESVSENKNVDMAALRRIASGEGLKGEFSLTKNKVVIDELYDFEIGNLPDVDDRVYIDKKSIAMVDKYNPGVYYVIWEGRNLMFTKKSEFDRFAKDNLTII